MTNFGTARNTELLRDTVKQKFLINTVIGLLKNRNGDGVNFDLESVALTQKKNLVSFISRAVSMRSSDENNQKFTENSYYPLNHSDRIIIQCST